MTDIFGPGLGAGNVVTVRPADARVIGASDTFAKNCSTPTAQDGTAILAEVFNQIIANLRAVVRGRGITENNADDNMLLKAVQSVAPPYAVDTGAANALVVDVAKPGFAIGAGTEIDVKLLNNVTGATTIDVKNSAVDLGTFNIVRADGSALNPGDLVAGQVAALFFDGAQFQVTRAGLAKSAVITPTILSANTNDYAPTSLAIARRLRISSSAAVNLTGLTGGSDARDLDLENVGSFAITLTAQDAGSAAANRFASPQVLRPNGLVRLVYDGTLARWVIGGSSPPPPTMQVLNSGSSATYTTPAGCTLLEVRAVGGGGGGSSGGNGGTTSFNSVTAVGGSQGGTHSGLTVGAGGAGGTGGSGAANLRLPGAHGAEGGPGTGNSSGMGGMGGGTPFGGAGAPGLGGFAAVANSGSGGGGSSISPAGFGNSGDGGGGAGEYFELIIGSPAATYTYTVGAGGGNGAAGRIVVKEFYN
jgi:hypothetical protein